MNDPTDTLICYSFALDDALSAFKVLEKNASLFERFLIFLLKTSCRRRLLLLIRDLPPCEVSEEILRSTDD
jgi:hypothetical protein